MTSCKQSVYLGHSNEDESELVEQCHENKWNILGYQGKIFVTRRLGRKGIDILICLKKRRRYRELEDAAKALPGKWSFGHGYRLR